MNDKFTSGENPGVFLSLSLYLWDILTLVHMICLHRNVSGLSAVTILFRMKGAICSSVSPLSAPIKRRTVCSS